VSGVDEPVRVMVVDDHQLVAEGIAGLLEDEDDLTVVGRAASIAEAVLVAESSKPQVVLMDFRLPDGDGVEGGKAVRTVAPDAALVMLTASVEHVAVSGALGAGFSGFVGKHADPDELLAAVRAAAAGEAHFSAETLAVLVRARPAEPAPNQTLSDRELEVLRLVAAGSGTGEIASALNLSQHTVRNHVRNVLAKLDAHSKLEAVVIATRLGLIDLPSA
jgi:DNA-binding NarL/FixJ family response regulator